MQAGRKPVLRTAFIFPQRPHFASNRSAYSSDAWAFPFWEFGFRRLHFCPACSHVPAVLSTAAHSMEKRAIDHHQEQKAEEIINVATNIQSHIDNYDCSRDVPAGRFALRRSDSDRYRFERNWSN